MIGLSLCACQGPYEKLNKAEIEKVEFWSYENSYKLTDEEIDAFLDAYNDAEYDGMADGSGGTPEFGFRVYFVNGDRLYANEFGRNYIFETAYNGSNWFYLNSEELLALAQELTEKCNSSK